MPIFDAMLNEALESSGLDKLPRKFPTDLSTGMVDEIHRDGATAAQGLIMSDP